MKLFWVDVRPWDKEKATRAIESGADALIVDEAAKVHELGRIMTIAPDGDLVPERDVFRVEITGKESEDAAVRLASQGYVITAPTDWTVIPLENLVAQSDRILVEVSDSKEAETALQVLEKGVCGVVLCSDDLNEIGKIGGLVKAGSEEIGLEPFTITAIRQVGMGDRVCVDTCTLFSDGQGMLVGNTSSAFLLVHAETLENPYVAPRPFRVNAGAVHAYALMPGGKTVYLSEIRSGDHVLVANADGTASDAVVGRVKVERRPLLLIEAEGEGGGVSLILQNAETIRLVGEDGKARSVIDLEVGDRILGATTRGGRHFGMAVEETILEK